MRTKRIQRLLRWLAAIISIWPLVSATAAPAVYAQHARTVRHAPANMYKKMPPGHEVVHLGKSRYYVHGGVFYVKKPPGFVEVRAPLGAIVFGLPIGAMALLIGGITYYVYNDVYYRKVPKGYVVVERPSDVVVVKETSAAVPSPQKSTRYC